MFYIEIDKYTLEETVKALKVINPARPQSAEDIKTMIRANMWDGSTSLGNGGWEATGYFPEDKPGTLVVSLSLSAYSVNKYLETLA